MEQPDDRIVEEMFLALMDKRGWYSLPPDTVKEFMGYSPAKKWTLVAQDALTSKMLQASQNKVPSERVERANATRITKPGPPPSAAQSGGPSVARRKPAANAASKPASGAGHIPGRGGYAGGSLIAPIPRRALPGPAALERELDIEDLQGDVLEDIGPLTQGDASLNLMIADGYRSLAAGEAEVDRRFNPVSFEQQSLPIVLIVTCLRFQYCGISTSSRINWRKHVILLC
jgi:hypothetical protein